MAGQCGVPLRHTSGRGRDHGGKRVHACAGAPRGRAVRAADYGRHHCRLRAGPGIDRVFGRSGRRGGRVAMVRLIASLAGSCGSPCLAVSPLPGGQRRLSNSCRAGVGRGRHRNFLVARVGEAGCLVVGTVLRYAVSAVLLGQHLDTGPTHPNWGTEPGRYRERTHNLSPAGQSSGDWSRVPASACP